MKLWRWRICGGSQTSLHCTITEKHRIPGLRPHPGSLFRQHWHLYSFNSSRGSHFQERLGAAWMQVLAEPFTQGRPFYQKLEIKILCSLKEKAEVASPKILVFSEWQLWNCLTRKNNKPTPGKLFTSSVSIISQNIVTVGIVTEREKLEAVSERSSGGIGSGFCASKGCRGSHRAPSLVGVSSLDDTGPPSLTSNISSSCLNFGATGIQKVPLPKEFIGAREESRRMIHHMTKTKMQQKLASWPHGTMWMIP